ncbi:helix-turn-helix domain-containing protein, partial [Faecalibaculum rodentium]
MRYYEILKKRRTDLKLSIQDVSAQTRLAPEYIKAIEDNDLDVFSDDLSFVRYFIRSYCEALGVNWSMLQEEVDGSIKHYAHLRNMALTQAQKRMAASMPMDTNESRVRRTGRS